MQSRFVAAAPVTPGQVLHERFLAPGSITQDQLARALLVSRFSVNQIVNGRRAVTAEMALRLATVTSTTPEFWLNLQRNVDLHEARVRLADVIPKLEVLRKEKAQSELISELDVE